MRQRRRRHGTLSRSPWITSLLVSVSPGSHFRQSYFHVVPFGDLLEALAGFCESAVVD